MKKGFTLIELLVVGAIIGILSTAVITSFHQASEKGCKVNPTEGCANYKAPQKSSRLDEFAGQTGQPAMDSFDTCTDAMAGTDGCGCITDPDAKKECKDQAYNAQMLEECIKRYSS